MKENFPPKSKLDPRLYGPQESLISATHIEKNLDGLTMEEALEKNKLFILDHHDTFMPYLNRINALPTKAYASCTIMFLCKDDTLKPVAIELSLPSRLRRVFTPTKGGVSGALWQLAKAHATVNDSGYHELINHWLRTHAVIEPFVIATNRNLNALHPLHKLLSPHFCDTMNINALAYNILINAGGILERSMFPQKYYLEMSAIVYKNWRFDEEGLTTDLLKRGMAMEDESMLHWLRLMIQDYTYIVEDKDALLLRVNMSSLGEDDDKVYVEQNSLVIKGEFIHIFHEFSLDLESKLGQNPIFLVQGTLYLDIIKSCPPPTSGRNHFHTIKSHHNDGRIKTNVDFGMNGGADE